MHNATHRGIGFAMLQDDFVVVLPDYSVFQCNQIKCYCKIARTTQLGHLPGSIICEFVALGVSRER